MNDILRKSDLARLKVEVRSLELGAICSRPVSECGVRYDCIIDISGKLYRAQVKYADGKSSSSRGCIHLHLSKPEGRGISRPYTEAEIDVLLVYLAKIDKVLWIPIDQILGKSQIQIRYEKTLNNQVSRCRMAQDFIW